MTHLRIAESILNYRRRNTMSQGSFGARLGVSAQAVSKWEREYCYPDITLLPELSRLLQVSIAYLLGLEEIG